MIEDEVVETEPIEVEEGEAPPSAFDPPAPDKKYTLGELIVHIEDELGDIEIWETVLRRENKPLYPKMAQRRAIITQIKKTLELVETHEAAFRQLVIDAFRGEPVRPGAVRRKPK